MKILLGLSLCLIIACSDSPPLQEQLDEPITDQHHYLIPIDSIGVEVGDSNYVFGDVWGSCITADGEIAVLDKSASVIRFFTNTGSFTRDFSPLGEGPGEFLSIDRMSFDPSGNLLLGSYYDRKMAWYDTDLNLIREIVFTTSTKSGPMKLMPGEDLCAIAKYSVLAGEDSIGTEIALYTDDETPAVIYRRRLIKFEEGTNYQMLTGMTYGVGSDGRVFVSNSEAIDFLVTCFSADGDSLFSFGLDSFESIRKSDEMIAEQTERVLNQYVQHNGSAEGFSYSPNPFYQPITSISIDGSGKIWIRGEANSLMANVFSSNGEFLYTCEGRFPDWQETDGWNLRIGNNGILADPRNPEMYPVVYMMEEIVE